MVLLLFFIHAPGLPILFVLWIGNTTLQEKQAYTDESIDLGVSWELGSHLCSQK